MSKARGGKGGGREELFQYSSADQCSACIRTQGAIPIRDQPVLKVEAPRDLDITSGLRNVFNCRCGQDDLVKMKMANVTRCRAFQRTILDHE